MSVAIPIGIEWWLGALSLFPFDFFFSKKGGLVKRLLSGVNYNNSINNSDADYVPVE